MMRHLKRKAQAAGSSWEGNLRIEAQICWRWQWMDGCFPRCPKGRRHVCYECEGTHRGVECTAHQKGKRKGN